MVARPLTIVQMLPDLISGGVERGTLEMGAYLSRKGHKSIVISNGGPLVKNLESDGSRHLALPVGKKSPLTFACIPKLKRFFKENSVDILHLRSRVPAWAGWLAVKTMAKKDRPRIVTTFHGFYSVNKYSAIMTKGEKVIAVSRTIKEHILKMYGTDGGKIVLINRGFDQNYFNPERISQEQKQEILKSWGVETGNSPIILMPGRFTRLKGHSLFLESLEKIKHLPWTAVIIGNEGENPDYAEQVKNDAVAKGVRDRIVFAGHCNDMAAAYSVADLTVCPSVYPESFGRVAVESQAMAVPVIASALGGSLETIVHGKTGWHFSHTDSSALAESLYLALSDEQIRKHMGNEARKWVTRQFTTAQMCEQTLSVYQDLIDSNRAFS